MKSISGKRMCSVLETKGWKLSRVHGSHHIFTKEDHDERISVPVHGNEDLKVGMLRAIMKVAEIQEGEL